MLSEADIKDWEKIDLKKLDRVIAALEDDDFDMLSKHVRLIKNQLELLRDAQIKTARKNIPVLLQKGN